MNQQVLVYILIPLTSWPLSSIKFENQHVMVQHMSSVSSLTPISKKEALDQQCDKPRDLQMFSDSYLSKFLLINAIDWSWDRVKGFLLHNTMRLIWPIFTWCLCCVTKFSYNMCVVHEVYLHCLISKQDNNDLVVIYSCA